MDVNFKFKPNQKVKTVFGDIGIISMAAIDDTETHNYYVQRSSDSQWMREDQLESVES